MADAVLAMKKSAATIIIDDRKTMTLTYGWVFQMRSGNLSDPDGSLLGGCPLLVTMSDGKVHRLSGGLGESTGRRLLEWEKGPGKGYV